MKRAIVTGATGMIASALIRKLVKENVEVLPVEEKEETKVKEKVKKVRVTRKEPVKMERVEKIKKDDYTKDSEFTKTRILLANKVEYKLGKGWENTFKRARRNEVFKDKVWPCIYDSYQENKDSFREVHYRKQSPCRPSLLL